MPNEHETQLGGTDALLCRYFGPQHDLPGPVDGTTGAGHPRPIVSRRAALSLHSHVRRECLTSAASVSRRRECLTSAASVSRRGAPIAEPAQ